MLSTLSYSSLATFSSIFNAFMTDAEILLLGDLDEELSHSVFAVYGYIFLMFRGSLPSRVYRCTVSRLVGKTT